MIPEKLYQEILKVMPRPCVDVVLTYRGKVLLGHRAIEPDKGNWGLIGGQVNMGETTEQAVVRKVKEELGIDIDIDTIRLLGIFTCFGKTRQDICMTYRAEAKSADGIKLGYQHDKYYWAGIHSMPKPISPFVMEQINTVVQSYCWGEKIC